MSLLKVGILGLGRMGQIHLEKLFQISTKRPNMKITRIHSPNMQKTRQIAAQYGISESQISPDYKSLINDPEVNTVVNCFLTSAHFEVNSMVLNKGKHLFSEKPASSTQEELKKLVEIEKQVKCHTCVGFNRRMHSNFKKIRDAIQSGVIGNLEYLQIISRDPKPNQLKFLRHSGGIFLDMHVHDFDLVHFLTKQRIEEVYARGAIMFQKELEEIKDFDTTLISFKTSGGIIGSIQGSRRFINSYDQRVEVHGSEGLMKNENTCANEVEH